MDSRLRGNDIGKTQESQEKRRKREYMTKATLIPGDGIGPEITEVVKKIFKELSLPIEWEKCLAGQTALQKTKDPLPQETLDSLSRTKLCFPECLFKISFIISILFPIQNIFESLI